jgi:hypothetical protein
LHLSANYIFPAQLCDFIEGFSRSADSRKCTRTALGIFALTNGKPPSMKKYLTERNALTVMTSLFCLIMTIIAATRQSLWEAVAFALAFSFSIELLCHRVKENK